MAESKIEWTRYTYNPWRGCTKIADGCRNCYAAQLAKRNPASLGEWGPGAKRVLGSDSYRSLPFKWNRAAAAAGVRESVFALSLGDWLDEEVPLEFLFGLVSDIDDNRDLDWLLLTKRPENWRPRFEAVAEHVSGSAGVRDWLNGKPLPHVRVGASISHQVDADRVIPQLLQIPAAVHFLSIEPLLGPVNLDAVKFASGRPHATIDWVIVGGESGPKSRKCDVQWIRSLVRQCQRAGVPVFVKQLGARPMQPLLQWHEEWYSMNPDVCRWPRSTKWRTCNGAAEPILGDRKGGDIDEFPSDLRVREFPKSEAV